MVRRPGAKDCCRCGDQDIDVSRAVCDYIRDHMTGRNYIGLVCAKCSGDLPSVSVTWNICRECGFQYGDCENNSTPPGTPLCFWCEEEASQPS